MMNLMLKSQPLKGKLLNNAPLNQYTTWRVGGIAKQIYKPSDTADLINFLDALPPREPLLWLGLGSNTLISDQGFPGTVIVTQGSLKHIALVDLNTVRVEAGVSCAAMARFCARHHLAEAEFWAGIPGTMGGALRMNAGCFNGETWQSVIMVETIDKVGKIYHRTPDEFVIKYRQVMMPKDEWFIAAVCKFPTGDKEVSLQLIKQLLKKRADTQPTGEYNCGSVFKNPTNHFAAALIEKAGLKGKQIGQAIVSVKHANFIVNQENAKAKDIYSLIKLVQDAVYSHSQIRLTTEVHFVGDFDEETN